MKITEIVICFNEYEESSTKAYVSIMFDDCLRLNQLKIVKGLFGHFITFPGNKDCAPYKYYDIESIGFRKYVQDKVLEEYARMLQSKASA